MAKQYWVGEFFVDLSRNQIHLQETSLNLPPKALLVLTYLAENRGRVVSYEELLDAIWPDSVVTPNTLQRSIAQLRKAFGENSKAQHIIKTHAKQGYSVECEVRWSDEDPNVTVKHVAEEHVATAKKNAVDEQPTTAVKKPEKDPSSYIKHSAKAYYWGATITLLVFIVYFVLPTTPKPMQHSDLRYLTATDDKEFGPTYTSDGKFIVFHRYPEMLCLNHLWAKDADTMAEFQLTKTLGTYQHHSLSPDGENLVFIQQEDCSKPVVQNLCFKLMSLNFRAALTQPQVATELLRCEHSEIRKPVWIDAQHIAMMQKQENHWRLVRFSVADKNTSPLYLPDAGNMVSFTWSAAQQLFAVVSRKEGSNQYLEMLSPEGTLLSSHPIQLPATAPKHLNIYPEFIPDSETLIFSDGRQLYSLSYQGEVATENFQIDDNVGGPKFHPDGQRLLLIKGRYDSDVARMPLVRNNSASQDNPAQSHTIANFTVFERSINQEDTPKYQPGTNNIAFISARTGYDQIWLFDGDNSTLISDLPKGSFISNIHWDKEGKGMLALADMELHHLQLDRTSQRIEFPYPIYHLFHWDSDAHHVIANILVNGIVQFARIDLHSMDYQRINHNNVIQASNGENDALIYLDHMDRFWQQSAVEDKLIAPLTGKLAKRQRFVLHNKLIYGINKENQLWSYNLAEDTFTLLAEMPKNIDYLSDVNDTELLFSMVIAAKKEVIELSLAD